VHHYDLLTVEPVTLMDKIWTVCGVGILKRSVFTLILYLVLHSCLKPNCSFYTVLVITEELILVFVVRYS